MSIFEVLLEYIQAFFPDTLGSFDVLIIELLVYIFTFFIAISLIFALFKILKNIFTWGMRK